MLSCDSVWVHRGLGVSDLRRHEGSLPYRLLKLQRPLTRSATQPMDVFERRKTSVSERPGTSSGTPSHSETHSETIVEKHQCDKEDAAQEDVKSSTEKRSPQSASKKGDKKPWRHSPASQALKADMDSMFPAKRMEELAEQLKEQNKSSTFLSNPLLLIQGDFVQAALLGDDNDVPCALAEGTPFQASENSPKPPFYWVPPLKKVPVRRGRWVPMRNSEWFTFRKHAPAPRQWHGEPGFGFPKKQNLEMKPGVKIKQD